jgi:hypothetical protein
METVWIPVFILTLTQCIAPEGKMVCQESVVQYQFLDKNDCEHALKQIVNVASTAENVIVNQDASHCRASATESQAYTSLAEAKAALGNPESLAVLTEESRSVDATQSAHQERLNGLQECDDVAAVPPCKIGQIIVEPSSEAKPAEILQHQE